MGRSAPRSLGRAATDTGALALRTGSDGDGRWGVGDERSDVGDGRRVGHRAALRWGRAAGWMQGYTEFTQEINLAPEDCPRES